MKHSYWIRRLKNKPKEHTIFKSILMLFCFLTLTSTVFAAEIVTDQPAYAPGDSVINIGSAFQSNEDVMVVITHVISPTPAIVEYEPWVIPSDLFGDFETFWIVPDTSLGESLLITATGQTTGSVATTSFRCSSTELELSEIPDEVCPGETIEVCAELHEKCGHQVTAPLEGREILFFINDGNCGVNVGQEADASVYTDANGLACASITFPSTPGDYAIRVKFLGEDKPDSEEPPNSACDSDTRKKLSAANECESITADASACNEPPVCNVPADQTFNQCAPTQVSLPVSCSDVDGNLSAGYPMIVSGPGTLVGGNWVYTPSGDETAVVTIRCQDDFGAFCESTFSITFDINSAPVITCPADITINCDESSDPANTGSATATDDNGMPTITYTDTETAGACPQEKVITRTWTATDGCSLTDQCQQTITIVDNTAPVITCPADIAVECDASIDPSAIGTATATDNCDVTLTITYADVTVGNVITRTWTATDDCGNSDSCDQLLTIDDTTAPVITCPADIAIECDASSDPSNTGSATATDNCTASVTITYSDVVTGGACADASTITRTWTATDDASNSSTCDQIITINDNTNPVITCPADIAVECDGSIDPSATGTATATDNCDATLTITYSDVTVGNVITRTWTSTDNCGNSATCDQLLTINDTTAPVITCPADIAIECDASTDPSNTGSATATDNCDVSVTITYSDVVTGGACADASTITRTWTATDDANNSASCDQIITIDDNTAPVITCPADIVVECDASIDPSATGTATATDNCDATLTITYSDVTVGNVITRTWTSTDNCGNSATCDQLLTINDTTAPVITCPADIAIECDASTDPSATGTATATDNCTASVTITYSDVVTGGACADASTITRTWTATDDANNSSTCDQIITIDDNTAPVITCPADIAVECNGSIDPVACGTATATDNCDATLTFTYSDVTVGNVITRTWTATDDCGNSATCDQLLTIDDTTVPDITCPADIAIECDASTDPSNTGTATATDNCDVSVTITYSDVVTGGACADASTITRTWTATDDANNSATCDQIITIDDNTNPVITCPADIAVECDASIDPLATGSATATDNCDATLTITYSDVTVGNVITRTWTATDDCGNSDSCDQLLTIDDTTAPVITCPADIAIECDASTDPSNTGSATATDNCDVSVTITYSDVVTGGACADANTITRTWTATDDDNNSATCAQIITIDDNTNPIITCPADIAVECDASIDPSACGTATASDNCDATLTFTYSDVAVGNVITRTWTATDDCGNSDSCDQLLTIDDTTAPVITCPADIAIECDASTDPSNTSSATATDNCDVSVTITYSDVVTGGACADASTITRTWTATDDANNSASCDQIITIDDNTNPVITCPADIVVECNGSIDPVACGTATATDNCDVTLTITYSDVTTGNVITRTWTTTDDCGNSSTCNQLLTIDDTTAPVITCPADIAIECDASTDPSNTGSATATDNCDASVTITYSDVVTGGACADASTITRTWTATDDANNSATCAQIITIDDNTNPIITCPADIAVECDASIDPSACGTATATDNCDATLTITYSDVTVGNVITRTWTATDDCGNSSTCNQLLTIDDTTAPVITCPADIAIECDASTDPSNTGSATATDNCDVSVTITYTDVVTGGACADASTITRTWTTTDDASNSATCDQIITVDDTTDPVIACPADIVVECDASIDPSATGSATATDNCDATLTITYSDVTVGNVITRTWTTTDDCGNSATCDQIITTNDITAPVITCPADIAIECDASTDPSNTGTAIATDNCTASVTITYTDVVTGGACADASTITRTWTATDDASNSATCDQIITVDDTTDPVIACPADIVVECDASIDPSATGTATATDNCDATLTITYSDVTVGNVITRTWTTTDDCGNSATCDQIITTNDITAPVITCPADIAIECDASTDPSNTGTATATDNCDVSVTITYSDVVTGGACADASTITRTWTATDDANNSATCDQIITIDDNTNPVITCPADIAIECDASIDPLATGSATATDNCDATLTITYSDVTVGNVITRTWTATDDCGNSATCDQNITFGANAAPVANCPANIDKFVCDLSPITISGFSCTDSDGNLSTCEVDKGTLAGDEVTFTPVDGLNTITLTATDDCGETSDCTVEVMVTLNSPPVAHCPGNMTIYLFELEEICIPGFYCDDDDDNLVSCEVNVGTLIGDELCFTPVEGDNELIITATDACGAGSKGICECIMNVNVVLIEECPIVTISTEEGVLQGHNRDVTVTIENATYEIGGYDFLIAYDASALSLLSVEPIGFYDDCAWEYFTYRFGANGNCGNSCPSGVTRVFALAETNDGYNSPSCYGPPDQGIYSVFSMRFFVTNDRTLECNFAPINFHWHDCGDNSISSATGDTLFIDKVIYEFQGNMIWNEDDDDEFPDDARLPFVGAADYCLINPMPDKPTAIRCIDFRNGGINIICADDIDARGDLNLNGILNEIADAVILTNYFTYGLGAFTVNVEGQIAASDANADGISLSVADLVYIIRVITGDVLPIDKILPYKSTARIGNRGSMIVTNEELGGVAMILEGEVEVVLTENSSHMQIKSNFDGVNTRVVVYSFEQGAVIKGDILKTEGKLLLVEASDYYGNLYKTITQLPNSFSLTSYPNPFNPSTVIEMNLPIATDWNMSIYNVSGQKVSEYSGINEAGLIKVTWDATGQSTGLYFIKVQAGEFRATKKAILLK